jgi:hypothetical protein
VLCLNEHSRLQNVAAEVEDTSKINKESVPVPIINDSRLVFLGGSL